MAKWADYLISGVWKDNNHVITHVLIHTDLETTYNRGVKYTRQQTVNLIKQNNSIITVIWNYEAGTISKGHIVTYETRNGIEYLRTKSNNRLTDNLDNLLNYGHLISL